MAKKDDKSKTKEKSKKNNIIELDPSNVVPALECLLDLAKKDKINSFIFCGLNDQDEFISTICDCSLVENMALLGHLQSLATIKTLTEIDFIDDEEE